MAKTKTNPGASVVLLDGTKVEMTGEECDQWERENPGRILARLNLTEVCVHPTPREEPLLP